MSHTFFLYNRRLIVSIQNQSPSAMFMHRIHVVATGEMIGHADNMTDVLEKAAAWNEAYNA